MSAAPRSWSLQATAATELERLEKDWDACDCLQSFSQDQHTLLSIFLPRSLSLQDGCRRCSDAREPTDWRRHSRGAGCGLPCPESPEIGQSTGLHPPVCSALWVAGHPLHLRHWAIFWALCTNT
eukprot:s2928_g3.t1